MKPKTAFFLGAVSAKLDFLREDLESFADGMDKFPYTAAAFNEIIDTVDKIRDLVSKIYDVENAEETS